MWLSRTKNKDRWKRQYENMERNYSTERSNYENMERKYNRMVNRFERMKQLWVDAEHGALSWRYKFEIAVEWFRNNTVSSLDCPDRSLAADGSKIQRPGERAYWDFDDFIRGGPQVSGMAAYVRENFAIFADLPQVKQVIYM